MSPASADFTTFHFTTDGVPPADRFPTWYNVFDRSVTRRLLSPLSGYNPCHAKMTVWTFGPGERRSQPEGACVQRVFVSGGVMAQRTPALLGDGNDDIILHFHKTGHRVVSQLGREAVVDSTSGLLTSNADVSAIRMPELADFYSVAVPRKLMTTMVPNLEDAFVRPLPPRTGVLSLLTRYLEILDDDRAIGTPELRRAICRHIHDLCALAIGATRDAAEIARGRGLRAARLRAIKADIARNLGWDDLSAASIALRQRITPRYIHKLFEGEGTTFSHYVLGQRLSHVYRLLTDPRHDDRAIAALAFEAGFGDLSTFNRRFRRHFGATPSDVRATAQSERTDSDC